jgi:hypothetical protein
MKDEEEKEVSCLASSFILPTEGRLCRLPCVRRGGQIDRRIALRGATGRRAVGDALVTLAANELQRLDGLTESLNRHAGKGQDLVHPAFVWVSGDKVALRLQRTCNQWAQ